MSRLNLEAKSLFNIDLGDALPCCQAEEFVGEIVGASAVAHIAHSCL